MHTPSWPVESPIGFAHRGARAERRENTLDAFVRALELGATGLESDAWVTADGQVVLDHDGVTGPFWRRQAIAARPRADLPAHIPSLGELYQACGGAFELSLDVKGPGALEPILSAARAAVATARLWLCHPDWRVLAGWRAAGVEARLVESTRVGQVPEGLEARVVSLRGAGIDALNLPGREWSAARVDTVHRAGLRAFGWGAQHSADITRLVGLGADGVYSDHVDRMMAAIAGRRP